MRINFLEILSLKSQNLIKFIIITKMDRLIIIE
jgi:hypothetical protein